MDKKPSPNLQKRRSECQTFHGMTLKNISYSNGTTDGHKLINAHDVWTMLSSVVTFSSLILIKKSMGIAPLSIKYFFRRFPITYSTWIRTFAMVLVSSTSSGCNWLWPLVKLGISNFAPNVPNVFAILNLYQP